MTATGEFDAIIEPADAPDEEIVSERRSVDQLVGAATLLGLEARPGSPLAALVASGSGDSRVPPDSRPTAAWASVVRALAAPERRIDAALTGSDGILVWAFHGAADGTWAGLWPEGDAGADQLRVTGPMTAEMVGGYVGVFFAGLRTPSPMQPIVTTEVGLAAAAAAIDAWRSVRLREWSEHRRPAGGFSADDLAEAHRLGVERDDGRWLTTMLADVSAVAQDAETVLGAGVAECRAAGLLRDTGGGFDLTGDLLRLANDVWFPQPSLVLTVGADTPQHKLVAIRGHDTVWAFVLGASECSILGTDDIGLANVVTRLATD
ncbi:MAG: hypothetical protein HKN41_13555 [Ilumatobacter sp.]|nr:hypothetical protein [Ilumatobacter sp.]